MTEFEWQVCDNPPSLRNACCGRVDPMRFRWLAVEWGTRIRPILFTDVRLWFDEHSAWVAGRRDYPNWDAETLYFDSFPPPPDRVEWASHFARDLRHDDPLAASVMAAMTFAEYLPRELAPPTDFNHTHRKKSKKAKAAEKNRTSNQVLRYAGETKAHRERTYWEFCEQFRCVAGYPFRPVIFPPTWRTETAVALAAGIYADRAFDRLPILADALEEAGCDSADVLNHCRGPGPHVRGCWVVDGVLGKT
jgi:hypothetical protein